MLMEMVHALEENNAKFLLEMGRAGGGEEHFKDSIQWTVGGSPLDYHNAVVRAALTEQRCDQEIAAFQAALTTHQVPGTWHLGPSMLPATLAEHLLAQGFVHDGDEVGMGLDLRLPPIDSAIPRQFTMFPVRTHHQLQDFAEVLAQGFGAGEREARWVQAVFAHIGLDESNTWQHVVGYVERTPVATVTLFFTGETVGLYFVATAPAWRRRGLGAAITASALKIARQREAQWAVLCASALGYSVYRRAGFSDLANIGIYRWQPPPATTARAKTR